MPEVEENVKNLVEDLVVEENVELEGEGEGDVNYNIYILLLYIIMSSKEGNDIPFTNKTFEIDTSDRNDFKYRHPNWTDKTPGTVLKAISIYEKQEEGGENKGMLWGKAVAEPPGIFIDELQNEEKRKVFIDPNDNNSLIIGNTGISIHANLDDDDVKNKRENLTKYKQTLIKQKYTEKKDQKKKFGISYGGKEVKTDAGKKWDALIISILIENYLFYNKGIEERRPDFENLLKDDKFFTIDINYDEKKIVFRELVHDQNNINQEKIQVKNTLLRKLNKYIFKENKIVNTRLSGTLLNTIDREKEKMRQKKDTNGGKRRRRRKSHKSKHNRKKSRKTKKRRKSHKKRKTRRRRRRR